jgi:hypothetical protein
MDKWCANPILAGLLTEQNCVKWAETADHFTGVAEDPDEDAMSEFLETMFEPEDEVLQLEQFVSGCTAAETEAAIEKFEFDSNAVVMHTKWLNYGRKSDVITTGGTINNTLWYKGMSRFRQWKEFECVKLANACLSTPKSGVKTWFWDQCLCGDCPKPQN